MSTQSVPYVNGHSTIPMSMVAAVEETPEPAKEVTRLRDLKTSARDQLMIDPRIIIIDDGHNPRNYNLPENHAHLDALKRSIRENGTLVPLLVRFDPLRKAAILVDGESRLRANLELIAEGVEIDTVPTIQVPGGNEQERLLIAITANTGKPLSKWELGGAFQRLYNHGWSTEKISTRTGYKETFVAESMELADAPDEVKQMLSAQAVTPALALSELRANGAAAVQTLQNLASEHKATGKQGPARRAKAAPSTSQSKPAPAQSTAPAASTASSKAPATIPQSSLTKAILALMEGVPPEDLNDPEGVAVVKVSNLLKVLSYALTPEDFKAAGIELDSAAF